MFDFHQKRKLRSVLHSRITQVILLLMAISIFWSAYDRYLVAREMSDKRLALEQEMKNLEERQIMLDREVKYLSSDRGVEAEMRRQFDIAREGEQVVVILDDDNKATASTSTVPIDEVEKRPWYKFW